MRRRTRSRVGWSAITLVGAVLAAYDVAYLVAGDATGAELATSWVGPAALTAAIGALALVERDPERHTWPRGDLLAAWFLPGATLFALAVAVTLVVQTVEGAPVHDVEFAAANWAMGGGSVGLLVGWYDLRRRVERDRVERTQDEVERRAEQLTVLNRMLRHDVRTAMNLVIGYADLMGARDVDASDRIRRHANSVVTIADQARRVETMLAETDREPVDVPRSLAAEVAEVRAAYPGIDVSLDAPASATAWAFPQVEGAFALAFDAALGDDVDVLSVTCTERTVDGRRVVETVVEDDAPGTPDVDRLVLEEGETPLRHASGVGLWTAKWTVEECGGSFDFDAVDDRNRTTIRLPTKPPVKNA